MDFDEISWQKCHGRYGLRQYGASKESIIMRKNNAKGIERRLDDEFDKIYDRVSDVIAMGACHEIVFEDIDSVLSIIWSHDGSTAAIFDSLDTEDKKKEFIKHFQSASEWLIGWNRDDLSHDDLMDLAETIKAE